MDGENGKDELLVALSHRTCKMWLIGIAATLVTLSYLLQLVTIVGGIKHGFGLIEPIRSLIHVDLENNVPALYSVILLLGASIVSAMNYPVARNQGQRGATAWIMLAVLFLLLALDEFGSLHESLNGPGVALLHHFGFKRLTFSWVVFAIPALLPVGLYFLRFLNTLPAETRRRFVLSGVIYVSGAVGFESLSGAVWSRGGYNHLGYQTLCHLEEFLEMLGVCFYILAAHMHFARVCPGVRIRHEP